MRVSQGEAIVEQRKLSSIHLKHGNQVSGAGLRYFHSCHYFVGMYDELDAHILLNHVIFRGSGIFPKTAWRVMNHRHATHHFCISFGFLKRNHLAASPWSPGDILLQPKF